MGGATLSIEPQQQQQQYNKIQGGKIEESRWETFRGDMFYHLTRDGMKLDKALSEVYVALSRV